MRVILLLLAALELSSLPSHVYVKVSFGPLITTNWDQLVPSSETSTMYAVILP